MLLEKHSDHQKRERFRLGRYGGAARESFSVLSREPEFRLALAKYWARSLGEKSVSLSPSDRLESRVDLPIFRGIEVGLVGEVFEDFSKSEALRIHRPFGERR